MINYKILLFHGNFNKQIYILYRGIVSLSTSQRINLNHAPNRQSFLVYKYLSHKYILIAFVKPKLSQIYKCINLKNQKLLLYKHILLTYYMTFNLLISHLQYYLLTLNINKAFIFPPRLKCKKYVIYIMIFKE